MISDELFESYAAEEEAAASKSYKSGDFESRDYEEVKWVGCDINKPTIFRAVGGPPNSNIDNTTAKIAVISWVIDDKGKKMKLVRPSMTENNNYIINRIISKVLSPKWVNQQRTYPVKDEHPDIYNIITKNGLPETDSRYKMDKGWQGKEVIIMNVIDREDMEWHKANKHTKLLAKSITKGNNGVEFVDEGVSSYAVQSKLTHFFRSYGSWEKYDLAFIRTGKMENPYTIVNASKTPEEIASEYRHFISEEKSLTSEEESWERYDLSKMYKPTSAIKLFNRLRNTIKRIDVAIGTHFYEELEQLAKVEKEAYEEEAAKKALQNPVVSTPITEVEEAPLEENISIASSHKVDIPEWNTSAAQTTAAPAVRTRVSSSQRVKLPYEDSLSEEDRALIKSVTLKDDGTYDVEWNCSIEALAGCPTCKTPSPLTATRCPVCGMQF